MGVTVDRVRELVVPLLDDLGVELYDLDHVGGSLRVTVDRPGGIDVETLTAATRAISSALDEADVVPGAYTLEVSSPGIERPLRTEAHFAGAVGEEVKLKTRAGVEGDRRIEGRLSAVDAGSVTVTCADDTTRTLRIADVERAHTVYDWTPAPKPGKQKAAGNKAAGKKSGGNTSGGSSKKKSSPKNSSRTPSTTASPEHPTEQPAADGGTGSNPNSEATP